MDATILIVDDEPVNLQVLTRLLHPTYRVRAANSGASALRAAATDPRPDLILLDVMMPELDGYEVLRQLLANPATHDIPVLFLTALADAGDEERGLGLGAADYIAKPIKPNVVLARVRTQLEASRARHILRDHAALLEAEVKLRMVENDLTQLVSIRALAHLAETRDTDTGNHILRTQNYVQQLALLLRDHPRFRDLLTDRYVVLLVRSAPLHDIGKVAIPDAILQKPGPLNAEEWEVMKTHSRRGFDAIELAEKDAEAPVQFLALAKEIARWHHEKWDGSGYPDGLSGDAIPVSARIMALADVFDGLSMARVYKPALALTEVNRIMTDGIGTHFDPDMATAFLANFDSFVAIRNRVSDAATLVHSAASWKTTPASP